MKFTSAAIILLLLLGKTSALSQSFVNLNCEAANLSGYSAESLMIPATNAFPGWTVNSAFICYDNFPLSSGSIDLIDTNFSPSTEPIQGKYFALLLTPEGENSVSMGQAGQVPPLAESITFWGSIGNLQITFNGQQLAFETLGTTANYTIYGADISTFAGQTGQLLFTQPPFSAPGMIDNIQFSTSPVPEPCELALIVCGAALFAFRRRRKSST